MNYLHRQCAQDKVDDEFSTCSSASLRRGTHRTEHIRGTRGRIAKLIIATQPTIELGHRDVGKRSLNIVRPAALVSLIFQSAAPGVPKEIYLERPRSSALEITSTPNSPAAMFLESQRWWRSTALCPDVAYGSP